MLWWLVSVRCWHGMDGMDGVACSMIPFSLLTLTISCGENGMKYLILCCLLLSCILLMFVIANTSMVIPGWRLKSRFAWYLSFHLEFILSPGY